MDLSLLCCPYPDRGSLEKRDENTLVCQSCARTFPLAQGRPVLFDEDRSLFSAAQVVSLADQKQFADATGWRHKLRQLLPAASSRDVSVELLEKQKPLLGSEPSVLVVGCGVTGEQYRGIFPDGRIVLTDISLKGDAELACDGESLPFRDESFDCIVVDQVLEHAINPLSIVEEIYRCLKPHGIVYSGVPFHAPVHAYPFDFQRYTPLGHRLLFRHFKELDFRITQGPVSAFSLTLIGFLTSFSRNVWWRRLSSAGVRVLMSSVRWLDHRFARPRELTVPAASAFVGQKQIEPESVRSIIAAWASHESSLLATEQKTERRSATIGDAFPELTSTP